MIVRVGEGISATISEFDFDVSLVRDSRYPQAHPRFGCIGPYDWCRPDGGARNACLVSSSSSTFHKLEGAGYKHLR